jgi:uncharacterized membrane protein
MSEPGAPLPEHVESTVQAIAGLHAEHEAQASRTEQLIDAITSWLGRPLATLILVLFVTIWIGANLCLRVFRLPQFDTPPFAWLDLAGSWGAMFMTTIILASQRRAQILAGHREQLMLQLAFLSDHKQAKIISLLEELRRDDPLIENRPDRQAEAMTRTTDPSDVLNAIKATREELRSEEEARKK